MWLSFVNTEIAVVARSLAAMTGRQVLVDARVMGNITLQSSQAVTPEQAWTLFTQVLQDRKIGITISTLRLES
jgi:general secretion pathway protein D